MERYFSLKISTESFSTESSLTFRELQPVVSYKQVSYKKKYVHMRDGTGDFLM